MDRFVLFAGSFPVSAFFLSALKIKTRIWFQAHELLLALLLDVSCFLVLKTSHAILLSLLFFGNRKDFPFPFIKPNYSFKRNPGRLTL